MRRWRAAAWVLGAVLGAAPAGEPNTGGYRGPENNGIFPAHGLLKAWPHGGPKLLWKYPVDIGYAGATVAGDRVYIGGGHSTNYVYEFSLEGELRKRIATGSSVCHSGRFHGTRCQPLVVDEMVAVTTPNANIYGVDVARQVIRWKKNAWKDFGTGEGSQGWGMQETPMLDGEKVIFNAVSRNDETPPIVAIDIRSGRTVWEADPGKGRNYSVGSAHGAVFTHNGRRILAYPCWRGFLVLEAETGKKLWEFPDPRGSQKELTPVYNDGYLLTAPQDKLCRMVKLSEDGSSFIPLWERPYRGLFSQAVILDGRVYLFGDAADEPRPPSIEGARRPVPQLRRERSMPVFLCVDAGTGETIQHYPAAKVEPSPTTGTAAPLLCKDVLVVQGSDLACLSCFDMDVESRQFREQFRQATKRIPGVTFAGSPLVVDGLIYALTSRQELAALDAAGRMLWREPLVPRAEQDTPPPPTAELIAAGGWVYAVGLGSGDRVAVVRPGRTFEKVWDCLLPDGPAGLAFDGRDLYVRAGASLYCVRGTSPGAAQGP